MSIARRDKNYCLVGAGVMWILTSFWIFIKIFRNRRNEKCTLCLVFSGFDWVSEVLSLKRFFDENIKIWKLFKVLMFWNFGWGLKVLKFEDFFGVLMFWSFEWKLEMLEFESFLGVLIFWVEAWSIEVWNFFEVLNC